MIVPYSKTTQQDLTTGIMSATPVESLNIASIINSDTGPIDRVTLTQPSDVVDNFITGSAISADDNITIQSLGAALASVRVDVIRVNDSPLRVGVGSNGSVVYFDSSFNLISNITKVDISEVNQVIDLLESTINGVSYYCGTGGTGTSVWTQTGSQSISNYFKGLQLKGVSIGYTDLSSVFPYAVTVSNIDNQINNVTVTDVTSDIARFDFSTSSSVILQPNSYIVIGNMYFYVYGNGDNISDATDSDTVYWVKTMLDNTPSASEIMARILDWMYNNNTVQLPIGENLVTTLTSVSDTVTISNNLNNYLTLADKVITCVNGNVTAPDGWSITVGSVTYDSSTISSVTVQGILIAIYDAIGDLSKATISFTNTDSMLSYVSMYYYKSSSPTISLGSNYDAIDINPTITGSFTKVTHLSDADNNKYDAYDSQYINLLDSDGLSTCYYSGTKPTVTGTTSYTRVSSDTTLTTSDFLDLAYVSILADYNICRSATGLVIGTSCTITSSENISVTNLLNVNQTLITDEFAIVSRFPSTKSLFKYSYVSNSDEYSTFDVTYYFKDVSGDFTMSFDGNAVDGYGKSLYYTNYNEGDYSNPYIYVAKLTGSDKLTSMTSKYFGSEVESLTPTVADYVTAINKFIQYTDKAYQFIWDSGYSAPSLAKAMLTVGQHFHAQCVPSFPVSYTKVSELTSYNDSLGLNNYEVYKCVPAYKTTANGTFLSTLPGSLAYINSRVNAFNTSSQEFVALFGTTKGVVSAPNLTIRIGTDDRQTLLTNNINSIVKDNGVTYLIANATGQSVNSYLSEDQNVYMTNIMSQICDEYNPSLQGELNDIDTRAKVVSDLNTRIKERMIAGKSPKLAAFKVVCDATLNTQTVIEARELIYQVWVQYTPSIAYVLAYVKVVRLDSF